MSILLKNIIASYFHGLLMLRMRYIYFLHTVVLEILLKHRFDPLLPMLSFSGCPTSCGLKFIICSHEESLLYLPVTFRTALLAVFFHPGPRVSESPEMHIKIINSQTVPQIRSIRDSGSEA